MTLKPLKDRVVAIVEKPLEKTKSGILLGEAKERPAYAIVESVGPEVSGIKKGDKIVYKEYSTTEIKIDEKNYIITNRDYQINIKQFGNLINYLLPIKINSEGVIVNEVSKRVAMNSAIQEYKASGAALKSGIQLNTLYLGTGYNDKLRLPLDFGSDIYLIKEDNNDSREEE